MPKLFALLCFFFIAPLFAEPTTQPSLPTDVPTYLQDVSVTIRAGQAEGSGVITTRNGVNYIWTAAHVIADLRSTRDVIDTKSGGTKTVVEFQDAVIVKELVENGRRVGQIQMDAEVIRYSNADTGEDLAVMKVRKLDFVRAGTVFNLNTDIPKIGTEVYHCGSLKGQFGSNSMTSGIISQIGRVYQNKVYDQTTSPAFPGSSGGGVFLRDGRYIGMLVRQGGETFNLFVPLRRMQEWAKRVEIDFTLDPSIAVPTDADIKRRPVEDTGTNIETSAQKVAPKTSTKDDAEIREIPYQRQ